MAEYKRHHDEIWPEIASALQVAGLTNLSIWNWGPRLFYYGEYVGDRPFDEAMAEYSKAPRVAEWEELMHAYQKQLPGPDGAAGSVWWQPMDLVYSSAF